MSEKKMSSNVIMNIDEILKSGNKSEMEKYIKMMQKKVNEIEKKENKKTKKTKKNEYRELQQQAKELKQNGFIPYYTPINTSKDQLAKYVKKALIEKRKQEKKNMKDNNPVLYEQIKSNKNNRKEFKNIVLENKGLSEVCPREYFINDIKKGSYMVSFDIYYYHMSLHFKRMISTDITINKTTKYVEIVDNILSKWLNNKIKGNHPPKSDIHVTKLDNFQYEKKTNAKLNNIKMKGTKLIYKFLGNIDEIQTSKGECVIDYLTYECSKVQRLKRWNRYLFIKYFGEDCIKEGISTEQICNWAQCVKYVSVDAMDPFMKVFNSQKSCGSKTLLHLTFIVNNEHCYPILDKQLCKSISQTHALKLTDIVFNLKFNHYEFVSDENLKPSIYAKSEYMNIVKGNYKPDYKIILLEKDNLNDIIVDIGKHSNYMVTNMKLKGSHVTCLEHPISKQIFVASPYYNERKSICDTLYNDYKCSCFTFNNQSFLEIAKDYFKFVCKKQLFNGVYSNDYLNILQNYPKSAFVGQCGDRYKLSDVISFDVVKAYTHFLIVNNENWGVSTGFDHVVEYDGKLEDAGEYYIDKVFKIAGGIPLGKNWYSLIFVKYCIENDYITHDDIKYVIKFGKYVDHDYFKYFAESIYEKFGSNGKNLVNHFIGDFGRQSYCSQKGVMTNSFLTAMSCKLNEEENNNECVIDQFNGNYFIRSYHRETIYEGNIPIFRQVIDLSFMKLDSIYKMLKGENTKVVSYTVDSIKLINPCYDVLMKMAPHEITEEQFFEYNQSLKQHGSIKIESKVNIRGKTFHEIENEINERPDYRIDDSKVHKFKENDYDFNNSNGGLIIGVGGSGKTHVLCDMVKKCKNNHLDMATTHKNLSVLRSRGIDGMTFASVFNEFNNKGNPIKKYGNHDIFVDEYSMTESKYVEKLMMLKNNGCRIWCFGDSHQLPAVEDKTKDYINNKMFLNLCNNTIVKLDYKGTRYDMNYYKDLKYFRKHRKMPLSWKNKKDKECWINLCFTNKCRIDGNARKVEEFCTGKEVFIISGKKWALKMPVICYSGKDNKLNKYDVYNSENYVIEKIDNENVYLNNDKIVPIKLFGLYFEHGFFSTTHKFQGGEILEDYCIHEIDHYMFDYNLMYTALSRGVSLDKVHFNYTDRYFNKHKHTKNAINVGKEIKLKVGRIYKIFDKDSYYIGSTKKTLKERLAEHKENPTNAEMAKMLKNKVKIELLSETNISCKKDLLLLEEEYIRNHDDKERKRLNVLCTKEVKQIVDVKIDIQKHFKEIKIKEYKNRFVLNYTLDGNKQKEFKFNEKNKDEIYEKAQIFRDDIMTRLHGSQ